MAEVTFRIPSKAVTYGYVEFPMTFDDNASAEVLASVYVNFVYAFQKEEQAALQRIAERPSAAPAPAKEATYRPGSREGAERQLAEGKNPRTVDEANEMAKQVIEKELGPVTELPEDMSFEEGMRLAAEAGERDADKAPWEAKVDAKPKPWETGGTAKPKATAPKAVVSSEW